MPFDRRRFLQTAAGGAFSMSMAMSAIRDSKAALAASKDAGSSEAEKPGSRIVDTHQHLWDVTKQRLAWIAGAPEVLRSSHRTQEYRAAIAGLGAEVRAVYMEVDVVEEQEVEEAETVVALAQSGAAPTVAAVVGGRPASSGFNAYLDRFRNVKQIKGIRQVLHVDTTPAGHCLSEAYQKGVQELGKRGLSFDLCLRPTDLSDGRKLAAACPETRFIVDHCGNADPKAFMSPARLKELKADGEKPWHEAEAWKREMEGLAKQPNTTCKISGIIARAPQGWNSADLSPIVNHCLDTFGPERVLFGSDWPVCLLGGSLQQWVEALREIVASRPADDQLRLWRKNAEKFYTL